MIHLFPMNRKAARRQKPRTVRISGRVLSGILAEIASREPEQGGVLGISKCGVITCFRHDTGADTTGITYSPDTAAVQSMIRRWEKNGIRFCGFVHSHPGRGGILSEGDRIYAERILKAMPRTLNGILHLPIVTADPLSMTANIRWYLARLTANGTLCIEKAVLYCKGRRICGKLRITGKTAAAYPGWKLKDFFLKILKKSVRALFTNWKGSGREPNVSI